MHGISTIDGFVEMTECLAEMIKYVANEPSVGLFYVQQHAQNAIPNVIKLKSNVVQKSCETNLHGEDLEDSITVIRSMKECGGPIVNEMVGDIRKSLAIMAEKKPKRGLIQNPASGFQTETFNWGHNGVYAQRHGKKMSNYFSTMFKNAKERASYFKQPKLDSQESTTYQNVKLTCYPTPSSSVDSSTCNSSSLLDMEAQEPHLSTPATNELQMKEGMYLEEPVDVNLPPHDRLSVSEDYDDFKANKEAKLEEWLGRTSDILDELQRCR
uniref:Protein MEF2BNB homolog n=1 Tax=Rhizophora mucronata TaxID=61149 RepID=A0A2P2ILA0_RHIMU